MKYCFLFFIIHALILSGCRSYNTDPGSEEYKELETNTYLDIMDSLLTFRWDYGKHKNETQVFVLTDSLLNPDIFMKNYHSIPPYGAYLKINLNSRFIQAEHFSKSGKYIFLPHKDYRYNRFNDLDSIYGVINSKLDNGQWFTGGWILLSRICYNEDFSRGYFFYTLWRGPKDAEDYIFTIEKVKNKWRICYSDRYGVS